MTIRNLDQMFKPKSLALIGASRREHSVGAVLARALLRAETRIPIYPVNPRCDELFGVPVHRAIADLPQAPELAIVATPPETVPGIIAELGARGTKAAVVVTAGFGEGGHEGGRRLRQAMLEAARPHLLRIVGPNCLGIMMPALGINASFAATTPLVGHLAFVAQSGAIVSSVVDWATSRGIGFSYLVSLGDMADVDFGDMLDYLANDRTTRAILLYIEAVTDARKFMSAARAASRSKPVIVVKAGRHAEGARAAASHTGALAGSDEVFEAAFRRAGMLRVIDLDELFDAVETLARSRAPRGERLAILTNGGGMGVLATDALIDQGGHLADLAPETIAALDAVLPPTWSRANPVDIIGDAPGARYAAALEVLAKDEGIDGLLVLNCPTAVASPTDAAEAVIASRARNDGLPVLTSWVGGASAEESRRRFAEQEVPSYDTPSEAVRAFMQLVNYRRSQEALMETPPSLPEGFRSQPDTARAVLRQALTEGREWLTEPEAKALLAAYAIPVSPTRLARTPQEAAEAAAGIGGPVVLKILSPDISHKTEVGGVALDLLGPAAVRHAAEAMLERVASAAPQARLDGFTVQPMIQRPGAFELIAGVVNDPQFGPVILFGQGGVAVEVIGDKALALAPLNMRLARDLMERTRVHRLLRGYRGLAPANLEAVAFTLVKLSQLVVDLDEVSELDINPLIADEFGVLALDARIRVAEPRARGGARLAIRPYPSELEEEVVLADRRKLLLRPVRPEDEPALQRGFARLTPDEIHMRFFVPMKALTHVVAARFTQIDYDREMALVLTENGIPGRTEIYGVVRITSDPDGETAEFAIIIQGEMTGQGIGLYMMKRIIAYARNCGIREIYGEVLRENNPMLSLCEFLGFTRGYADPDDRSIVRVRLKL